jgi:hypothetical protein
MTDASLPAGRFTQSDFRIGNVFSRAWSVFSRNFLIFSLVTLVANLPSLFMPRRLPGEAIANPFQDLRTVGVVIFILMVLSALSQAVLLYGAFEVMRGRPVNFGESLRIGLRRFFPIVGIAIVVVVLASMAAVLLIFPGIMLYVMWFVAAPVCVVERLGPFASMGRSRQLTKGHRWKIFGMLLLLLIPAIIIGAIVGAVMGAVGFLTVATAMSTTVAQIVGLIWKALWSAFLAILVVVTYHDLRVAKEGIDTDQIAAVFE